MLSHNCENKMHGDTCLDRDNATNLFCLDAEEIHHMSGISNCNRCSGEQSFGIY